MPKIIKVCVDRILPRDLRVAAADRAVSENPANAPVYRPGFGVAPPTPLELAAVTGKLWPNGRTLRVRFLDGIDQVQAKVVEAAQRWMEFANIVLEFGSAADAELRVSFAQRGSWSYIGMDALSIEQSNPTINFGWLTPASEQEEINRVVVHEFGHALGCIHEHQNPAAEIPWNKEAVYRYYAGPPNNWSREQVDLNLFDKYDRTITQFSEFDPQSIMLYPIPKEHALGGFEVGWNKQLSPLDKQFIGQLYPKAVKQTATLNVIGVPVEAEIGEHGEEDLYEFAISAGGRYQIETEGETDVVMTLHAADAPGVILAEDDDSGKGFNAKIVTALAPGRYGVRIRHYRPTGVGKYRVSVKPVS
jgi:hypothetical protein